MKKFLILIGILFYFQSFAASKTDSLISDTCEYKSEFEECMQANASGGAGNRSISNFICISSQDPAKIMAQIVLDKEFKKVDQRVGAYLTFLENSKDYYFGKNAREPFITAIDEIDSKFSETGDFGKGYMDLCVPANGDKSILGKTLGCFSAGMASRIGKDFFLETDCSRLAATKNEIAKRVSYDLLKLNKFQVGQDEGKLYKQKQRTKYDKLIDIAMINIGYLERIWKKWPSKIKNTY